MRPRIEVPSKARKPVGIRLSRQEREILEAAARRRPEYLTTYIRDRALEAARRELAGTPDAPAPW